MATDPHAHPTPGDARSRSRPELLWFLRHADALARWPVIDEPWAHRVAEDGDGGLRPAAAEDPPRGP